MKLIIVESPAKARTISRFLGKDYEVAASYGHIRDLPGSASEIPAELQEGALGAGWASIPTTATRRSTWSPPTARSRSPS